MPTEYEFRVDPRDQQQIGGPKWIHLDMTVLDDTDYDTLTSWERQLGPGMTIHLLLAVELPAGATWAANAAVWLARNVAGIPTPPLAVFKLRYPRRVQAREIQRGADVDPPEQASSRPPSDGPTNRKRDRAQSPKASTS